MQKVVSNSSPIIHLAKIGELRLLKDYFERIIIPELVYHECTVDPGNYEVDSIKSASFLEIRLPKDKTMISLLNADLDGGESEAITLAKEIESDLILLDDSDARKKAKVLNLKIAGTLGILLRAKLDCKIASLRDMLARLRKTGFRISDKLAASLLTEASE